MYLSLNIINITHQGYFRFFYRKLMIDFLHQFSIGQIDGNKISCYNWYRVGLNYRGLIF